MQQHRSKLFLNCSAASPGSSTRTAGLIQARSSETPPLFMHNGNTIFHRPSALRGTLGPDKKCGRSWQWLSASEQVSSLSGSVEQCAHQASRGPGLVRMKKVLESRHSFILLSSPLPLAEAAAGGTRCTRRRACRFHRGCREGRPTPWCRHSTCPCRWLASQQCARPAGAAPSASGLPGGGIFF